MPGGIPPLQPTVVAGDVVVRENDVVIRPATNGEGRLVQGHLPQWLSGHSNNEARLFLSPCVH